MVPKDSRPARGDPSHDRFNAIFSMLSPAECDRCLLTWKQALHEATDGQVIAIDGMTLRGSFDEASNTSAIHMINAWASANSISLGQLVVDAKSYEITAIPKWVDMLQLKGATVTIDAAGCQTEIARRIVDAGGHFVLSVKGNQGALRDGIETFFAEFLDGKMPTVPGCRWHITVKGHGRRELRCHSFAAYRAGCPTAIVGLGSRRSAWSSGTPSVSARNASVSVAPL